MKKLLIRIGIFLLILTATVGLAFGSLIWRFTPDIPTADFPTPQNQLEAREQDLEYLRNFTSVDLSFSEEAASAFHAQLDDLGERLAEMSDAEFALGVAAAVALADNGHTNVRFMPIVDQLNSLPLRFFWFDDGLFIVRAHAQFSDLIGAQVVAYEGVDPETFVPEIAQYTGGKAVNGRYYSPRFFSSPAIMQAAGLITNPEQVSLTLRLISGEEREVTVQTEAQQTESVPVIRAALARTFEKELNSGNEWVFLGAESTTQTTYGMNPEQDFWTDELPNNGYLVRMRWTAGTEETALSQWLADIQSELQDAPADYLVIDLRANPGGDYTQVMRFARSVTELVKPDGRIYTLTDHGTFSAALVMTAMIKDAAGAQGQIVGSELGDREQFWAEGGGQPMTLPNSGLQLLASTGYHDWENGCTDWSRCFWVNILLGSAAGKLDPDIHAPLTFADYVQGIDTTMEAVFTAEENLAR